MKTRGPEGARKKIKSDDEIYPAEDEDDLDSKNFVKVAPPPPSLLNDAFYRSINALSLFFEAIEDLRSSSFHCDGSADNHMAAFRGWP